MERNSSRHALRSRSSPSCLLRPFAPDRSPACRPPVPPRARPVRPAHRDTTGRHCADWRSLDGVTGCPPCLAVAIRVAVDAGGGLHDGGFAVCALPLGGKPLHADQSGGAANPNHRAAEAGVAHRQRRNPCCHWPGCPLGEVIGSVSGSLQDHPISTSRPHCPLRQYRPAMPAGSLHTGDPPYRADRPSGGNQFAFGQD